MREIKRGSRFTLIELLVVIIIITILLSLVSVALEKAKEQARSVLCKSNLKQIGQAAIAYSSTRGEILPASFGHTTHGELNHWINYLYHIEGLNAKLFCCPSMSPEMMFDPDGRSPTEGNVIKKASYIMNIIKPGTWAGAKLPWKKSKCSGFGKDSQNPLFYGQLRDPSTTIFITDAAEGIYNTHSGINNFAKTDHGKIKIPAIGQVRWVGSHHHNQSFNALYFDGSVRTIFESKDIEWVASYNN